MDTVTGTKPVTEIYDPKRFDPRMGIGGLLSRVKMSLVDALDAELAQFDISAAQYVKNLNWTKGIDPKRVDSLEFIDPRALDPQPRGALVAT